MRMGLLGKKLGMTQVFEENGRVIPVTVLEVGPCFVTYKKNKESDGYFGVQIGYHAISEKKATKAIAGHCKKAGLAPLKYIKEIRMEETDAEGITIGQEMNISIFKEGQFIDVTGISRGKGFQGVVKRHGFKGGPATRGSMQHRKPGSIGGGNPQRVIKGRKMAGQMGNKKVTVQNLIVYRVFPEKNLMFVKGAVPGGENSIVFVRHAVKKQVEK
ncbi:MAG: 50S ribosomal protein L3 [Candidatus Omnitrophica bacterium]|nr:50S ribosomal protein L3 [Candidatus Omnitrophota bacterium]MCM8829087.1 50S ribosomal protein L3 [Candidatus Omnitrophota bacterium]